MKHLFINKNSKYTLIMLHGTGGTEEQMANFGKTLNDTFNILSIRGNISENGMNRYFKRYGMGSYDIDNYILETKNLNDSIIRYMNEYQLDLDKAVVTGFSNGANIALGLIQDYPKTINNYILLSPDHINKDKEFKDLSNINILMSSSKNDPFSSYETIVTLQKELIKKGAKLKNHLVPGHNITEDLVEEIKKHLTNISK